MFIEATTFDVDFVDKLKFCQQPFSMVLENLPAIKKVLVKDYAAHDIYVHFSPKAISSSPPMPKQLFASHF